MRDIGCHISVAGGMHTAIERVEGVAISAMQIHPSPPQRWNREPYKPGHETRFLELRKDSSIKKVFMHAIYLINLATPHADKLELAIRSLQYNLELCERVGGSGVIFHVGSLKDREDTEDAYDQIVSAIDTIVSEARDAKLLLEVSAGGGKVIGAKLEDLRHIYQRIEHKERVNFALDTQHMWASGYDLKDDTEGVVAAIGDVLGFERIEVIHLNDSMTECGSKKDRHADLGEGLIGAPALHRFISHPSLKDIPLILETPSLKTPEGILKEVASLRGMLGYE